MSRFSFALRVAGVVGIFGAAATSLLHSQCPDGTPPPCRRAAAAPVRRANPPLDDRTWIVVPFENVTRAPDIDWLREASVNLLYLDMSKWRDIRVIDDERVADLMRDVPEVRPGQQLSLQAGIAVARRAGAGKLVMGDLLKVGNRTRVVAKVFDVRSGQRVRNVIQETDDPDSLMVVFGRLARGILNADPPGEAALGVGTTRLDAYQEYLAGVRALNSFDVTQARERFESALRHDSTFALAYYKLSLVIGWVAPNNPDQRRFAEAASRHSGGLPSRERTLIAAQALSASTDYSRACETIAPLVRDDSSDVEALYALGECSYHDFNVVPMPADTTRFMFRGSWNTAVRSFRRVLQLDPTYHLAFQHIFDAYLSTARTGCLSVNGRPTCGSTSQDAFVAAIRNDGDSLLLVPVRQIAGAEDYQHQQSLAHTDGSRRRNRAAALRAAEEWLRAGPTERRARIAYTRALLRMGRLNEAAEAARQMSSGEASVQETGQFALDRAEIAIKTGDYEEAFRIYDSVRMAYDTVLNTQVQIGVVAATLGRPSRMDTSLARAVRAPAWATDYFRSELRAVLGLPDDSLWHRENEFVSQLTAFQGADRAISVASTTLIYSLLRRGSRPWPASDTASTDRRVRLVSWLAAGDTTRFRRELEALDSIIDGEREEPDRGWAIVSAESHLLLGDSARALARLRGFVSDHWHMTPVASSLGSAFGQTGMLWPRTFLLLGDLEASAGQSAAAAAAYRRFIGMWQHGDEEVQPLVARARQALASLGQ